MTFFIFFKPNVEETPPVILPKKGYLNFKISKNTIFKVARALKFKKNRFKS